MNRSEVPHKLRPFPNPPTRPREPNGHRTPERAPELLRPGEDWWKGAVVYEIYPLTFNDSNGDGIGDLKGITQKLDYLKGLGVTALWLTPVYPSPMNDGGYDVSNYTDIDPKFGSLEDFDELVREAHERDIKITMDLVMNHTSNEHPWFEESRSSQDNPKRDWYVWADGKPDGSPPNNWRNFFDGGSAWTYDEKSKQYYLHKFDPSQPDLNIRKPEVKEAMKDVVRFWLDRGVDGFRMDVLDHIFHDESLADMKDNPDWKEGDAPIDKLKWHEKYLLFDKVLPWAEEIMAVIHEKPGAIGIAEIHGGTSAENKAQLVAAGVELPFNFGLFHIPPDLAAATKYVENYIKELRESKDVWPNFVWGNHDNERLASRVGPERAALITMFLYTLPGTLFVYNGDEIGMENGEVTNAQTRDPQGKREAGGLNRDKARTPIQWNGSPTAGFSEASPEDLWLPIGDNGPGKNVEDQEKDSNSILNLTKAMAAWRNELPPIRPEDYIPIVTDLPQSVCVSGRQVGGRQFLVALNDGQDHQEFELPEGVTGTLIRSTHGTEQESPSGTIRLDAYEGVILELGKAA